MVPATSIFYCVMQTVCKTSYDAIQCLLQMPQVTLALCTADVHNLGKTWGMCKECYSYFGMVNIGNTMNEKQLTII